ncbi:MAG: ornithine cyclodeaminase family protein [Bacteroidota bacterium]
MLILNKSSIEQAIQPKGMIEAVKQALIMYESGNFLMPDRMHINVDKNTLLLMPAFAQKYLGTKLVSVFPDNIKRNEPVIYGTMILNDAETGKTIALMDGSALTAHRTGAVGGLAAKILANPNMNKLGIVGAGVQSFHQALYICQSINIYELHIYDIFPEKVNDWMIQLKSKLPKIKIIVSGSSEELVGNSDIIVTATTSNEPVIPDKQNLYNNKLILAFGSYKPNMKEMPDAVYKNVQIFTDTEFAIVESGDLAQPLKNGLIRENQIQLLSKVLTNKVKPDHNKTIIFKSVGMALFDITVSSYIYNEAINEKLGITVGF